MAERLKDKGLRHELQPFRRRILRQAAMGRISKADADNLIRMVDELEAYVVKMVERPIYDEERQLW